MEEEKGNGGGSDVDARSESEDEDEQRNMRQFLDEMKGEGAYDSWRSTKKAQKKGSSFGEPSSHPGGVSFQTGPKGVLHDYKIAKQHALEQQEKERIEKILKIQQISMTVDKDEIESSDSIDEEEKKILSTIREQQLKEMEKLSSVERQKLIETQEKKKFGNLTTLQRNNYVDFIDKEHPDVIIIIHLFQNYIPACMRLNTILSEIAKKYSNVKFGKIISHEAKNGGFADHALPSILVYKAGDVMKSFIRVQDEVNEGFDFDDIEQLLVENGILNPSDAANCE